LFLIVFAIESGWGNRDGRDAFNLEVLEQIKRLQNGRTSSQDPFKVLRSIYS